MNAGFASVLDAVGVEIAPHEVANRSERRDVACVEVSVVLASREGDGGGTARSGVGIAVDGVGSVVSGGEYQPLGERAWEADAVGAGIKLGEAVEAKTVGRGGAHGHAGAVV